MKPYPSKVCTKCAKDAGGKMPNNHYATWHTEFCDVCERLETVTEPRDFRYPKFKGFKK